MKKLLLFICITLTGLSVNAQYTWISQATRFDSASTGVTNVSAADTNVVWITPYNGAPGGVASFRTYSRTIDGGLNWAQGTTPASPAYKWSMIFAHNADTAWALYYRDTLQVQEKGILYFTGDGGNNWVQQGAGTLYNATGSFPDIVYFWDGLQGVTIGDPNPTAFEIYTTLDAGNTWTPVPSANIPAPLASEYALTAHYSVFGNTIWFDTNKGRVFKSIDNGLNWTAASTGITVPVNGAMEICFYNANNGLARLYAAVTGTNTVMFTSDGGATWTPGSPTGQLFGSEVKYIPGTASKLISTGVDFTNGFIGSSFSDDGGNNWYIFETDMQRTAIGAVDSTHIWVGGFTANDTTDGIFKYSFIDSISCADPLINTGITSANDLIICPGEMLVVASSGVYPPNSGDFSGVSWVITTVDISGTVDPLNSSSLVAAYTFDFPAPPNSSRIFINNDTTLIGNQFFPYGQYFWTPVVFGNAIDNPGDTTSNPNFLSDLILDPSCTHAGTSIAIQVLDSLTSPCAAGIDQPADIAILNVSGFFNGSQTLDLNIRSSSNEKAAVKIYDLTGRMIYSNTFDLVNGISRTLINAQSFSAGLYLVQVETGNNKAVTKIAKQ